jgi:hypothetical protein
MPPFRKMRVASGNSYPHGHRRVSLSGRANHAVRAPLGSLVISLRLRGKTSATRGKISFALPIFVLSLERRVVIMPIDRRNEPAFIALLDRGRATISWSKPTYPVQNMAKRRRARSTAASLVTLTFMLKSVAPSSGTGNVSPGFHCTRASLPVLLQRRKHPRLDSVEVLQLYRAARRPIRYRKIAPSA